MQSLQELIFSQTVVLHCKRLSMSVPVGEELCLLQN